MYGRLLIHSSGNIRENKYYLQLIGAEARERLLYTAATEWKVPVSDLVAKDSVITHTKSQLRTTYGAIAAKAATMQLPFDPSTIRTQDAGAVDAHGDHATEPGYPAEGDR